MTTTTLITYAKEIDVAQLDEELISQDSPIYIVDYRQTSEGFPFHITIGFEGGSVEMDKSIAFITEKLELARWKYS